MSTLSKRMQLVKQSVENKKNYSPKEAVALLQGLPTLKFVESLEVSVHLAVNQKKSDQVVRGTVVLPHGTGRKTRVVVVTELKEQAELAIQAGATRAGLEDLINDIKTNQFKLSERDTIIATPGAMKLLMPLGPVLGPRGLMPNPKLGTVTDNPLESVRNALLGQVQYRADKGGVIRGLIGKLSFNVEALMENLQTFLTSLIKNKPDSLHKGRVFIKKVALSSTMGPELGIDQSFLDINTAL